MSFLLYRFSIFAALWCLMLVYSLICFLYVVDTMVADLLTAMGRRETVGRLLQEAPASSARDALSAHLAEQG